MSTTENGTGSNGHSAADSAIGQRHTVSFRSHGDPVTDDLMHDRRVRNDTSSSNETGLAKSDWELKTFSVACLIVNKMIGTGIFITVRTQPASCLTVVRVEFRLHRPSLA